jgi:hypothetical protein
LRLERLTESRVRESILMIGTFFSRGVIQIFTKKSRTFNTNMATKRLHSGLKSRHPCNELYTKIRQLTALDGYGLRVKQKFGQLVEIHFLPCVGHAAQR